MKVRKSVAKKRSGSSARKARPTAATRSVKKTRPRKTSAKKVSAKKAAKKTSTASSADSKLSGGHAGHVYVFAKSGTKAKKVHVAKKATVGQIQKALGISDSRISSAKSLIRGLENKGRISRAG